MAYLLGIDTGGTFTDVVLADGVGHVSFFKTLSTANPTDAILEGLTLAARAEGVTLGKLLQQTEKFVHGSTYAINRIIERKGALVGALVTKGFRDTIEIRRMMRASAFDLQEPQPIPFVRRDLVLEVNERLDPSGNVRTTLDIGDARLKIRELVKKRVEAIAICLLHSYANPAHEQQLAELVRREAENVYVCTSSELLREIREYERMSTTVFDAYVGSAVAQHFYHLSKDLQEMGLSTRPMIMQLQGGVMSTEMAISFPIATLNSGPAAGTVAAQYLGTHMDGHGVIAVDMGGTSFDVSLVWDGQPLTALELELERYPLMLPRIDVKSIGAGGGSIAWVDPSGALKVGPASAGAMPGPACYGRGGTEPTVTDADVVLGYIDPGYFLGGSMKLDSNLARTAMDKLASQLSMGTEETAAGVYQVITANMYDALRLLTVNKGYDPRDLVLVAFGGAGPTHAAILHRELGTRQLVIPYLASTFSAFGLLTAPVKHSYVRTYKWPLLSLDLDEANQILAEFVAVAQEMLRGEGVQEQAMRMRPSLDLSYVGQTQQVNVPISSAVLTPSSLPMICKDFLGAYKTLYGFIEREVPIQILSFRLDALGDLGSYPTLPENPNQESGVESALKGWREAYFPEEQGFVKTPVYDARRLGAQSEFEGPALVDGLGSSAVVLPGQCARIDQWMNLVIQ